jgi:hypothetical protein
MRMLARACNFQKVPALDRQHVSPWQPCERNTSRPGLLLDCCKSYQSAGLCTIDAAMQCK